MATSRLADSVGRVLGGRYRLLAPLGTGASASVFLAEDVVLRRRVAVKLLHAALREDESFLKRFRAEAQAAAALNHPNLLKVFDWGEDADGPYLVLEHLGGGSLRDLLDRGVRLTPSQALVVGLDAARALDHAHRRGLVHRDVKPANLLFDDEGRVRIADFGLARALAEAAWTEPSGALVGTARYAAPEQADGRPLDGRADVYALALTLVEAVTGSVPFAADTTVATLMARVGRDLEPPRQLGPLVGPLAAAGRADPADRIDAATFTTRLADVSGQLPAPEPLPLVTAPTDVDETALVDPTELPAPRTGVFDQFADDTVPGSVVAPASARTVKAPRRGRRRWLLALVAGVLSVALGVGAAAVVDEVTTPSHPVPKVEGLSFVRAEAALAERNLRVAVREEYDEVVPPGHVSKQSPLDGQKLDEGETVHLVVSKGPVPREVPDLAGLDEAAAVARLGERGLTPRVEKRHHEEIPAGTVVEWSPREGRVPKGSEVEVVVSDGPAPRTVPDVAGSSFDDAAAELAEAGLKARRVDVFHDEVPAGTVVSTDPRAGASAARDSTVTVRVSKGPDTVEVPEVAGMDVDTATRTLKAAGLEVNGVYGPNGKDRRVLFTRPGAGAKVKRGTAVDVYVGR